MARDCNDKLVAEIGDSGIFFCQIPPCDCIPACKTCDLFGVNALMALASEINKLQAWKKEFEIAEKNKSYLRAIGMGV